jgi:hypothetical protein
MMENSQQAQKKVVQMVLPVQFSEQMKASKKVYRDCLETRDSLALGVRWCTKLNPTEANEVF